MKKNSNRFAFVTMIFGLAIQFIPSVFAAGTSGGPMASDPTSPSERIEVLIGNVFVPDIGYEDKNNIEVTLDGYLPDSCYQIADTQVVGGPDSSTLVLHQFADHRTDGVCADPATIPPQMREIVPFTLNFNLGHLGAGNYKILFNQGSTPTRVSDFNIARSHTLAVDDYPYASVSAINISDVVNGVRDVTATLVGTFANSCQFLKDVKVLPEPAVNTIVVLPVLGYRTGQMCAQIILPFEYSVKLGRLGEGRYLLHVRSMNGQAVTRVFSVIRPDPDQTR